MTQKVKKVIKMLEENGWKQARMNGDHRSFVKAGAKRPIVVAGHLNDDIPIGTLKSIMRTMEEN